MHKHKENFDENLETELLSRKDIFIFFNLIVITFAFFNSPLKNTKAIFKLS